VDLAALENLIVRFSQLVVEQPVLKEIDINPLLASPTQFLALDARVVLHDSHTPDAALPRPAIRPYPVQYISQATLPSGVVVTLRPIRPDDEPGLVAFHEGLSERSVTLRYYRPLALSQRTAHERLHRITQSDYDREISLVAVMGNGTIAGIARLSRARSGIATDQAEATFTLLVGDAFQNQGLGTELLRRLIEIARAEGITRLTAEVLAVNAPMQDLCRRLGFTLTGPHGDPAATTAELLL
jgi:acetyltransferase